MKYLLAALIVSLPSLAMAANVDNAYEVCRHHEQMWSRSGKLPPPTPNAPRFEDGFNGETSGDVNCADVYAQKKAKEADEFKSRQSQDDKESLKAYMNEAPPVDIKNSRLDGVSFYVGGAMIVQVGVDGKITYGQNYTPDAAAEALWKALGAHAPGLHTPCVTPK